MVTTRGLTIGEVKGDTDWSALEEDLLAACETGRFATAMNDDPPEPSDPPPPRRKRWPRFAPRIRRTPPAGCAPP
jgi:hypothetical protein